jgi:uncharacterized protein
MQPEIKRLVELQAADLNLAGLRARLDAFPQQLAEMEKRLAEGRQQLAAAKEALTTSLKDRKKYEMDVDAWKEKVRKYRDQSFAVKTNEAFKALQHEITNAEQEVAQAEDRLLERMVSGEQFDHDVKAAERAVTEIERATAADRQKLRTEQAAVQKELQAKEAQRQELISAVPEDLLATYERVAQRRHGIGLAEVRDEACSLCGVRIRPHVFQELRRDDSSEIFQCETCTRILYFIEPPTPPAPADAHADTTSASSHDG